MRRTIRRGYVGKGWWDSTTNSWIDNEYSISISKVKQDDYYGDWEDDEEDEIASYGGYKSLEEAIESLKDENVKEIYDEKYELIWKK